MLETSRATAADVMSRDVAVVQPDTSLRQLLRVMATRRVSGVPVVDDTGMLVGVVTEGDLFRWHEEFDSREQRWLDSLAEGTMLPRDFVDWLRAQHEKVRVVMHSGDLATVTEDTPVHDIEALLATRRIKRVPVLRDGKVVGIVARADLVRLLARTLEATPEPATAGAGGQATRRG